MSTATKVHGFTPDTLEQQWIVQASRGSWDAGIDLAMRNILYDAETATWRKLPEDQEFEMRRRGAR